jgi:short-subunit dehydrogenase
MNGKVALVTGASSGIGLSVARLVVARGGRVALVARTVHKLDEVVQQLGEGRARAYPLDVTDLRALAELPGRVARDFGRLDLVVNNAGLNHRGPLEQHDALALGDVVTTNLTAPVVLSRAAVPHLGRGSAIVQVASIAGMVPVPHEATYSASKAGLRAFSRAAAYDLEDRGIHVGCVCPGPVDTGFLGDIVDVPDIVLSQPMIGPDEVAEAVLRCADEKLAEIALPRRSGRLATAAYLLPALARRLRPALERRGARNKSAILARKRGAT